MSRTRYLFAKFSLIIGENALKIEKKINPRERFLSTGWSHNSNFGVLVSSYDTWQADRARFWNFYLFQNILTIFRSNLAIFWNLAKNLRHIPKSSENIEIALLAFVLWYWDGNVKNILFFKMADKLWFSCVFCFQTFNYLTEIPKIINLHSNSHFSQTAININIRNHLFYLV